MHNGNLAQRAVGGKKNVITREKKYSTPTHLWVHVEHMMAKNNLDSASAFMSTEA